MLKLQMYSTMSNWATSIFNPKRTEALTPKRHFWLTLQPINVMLNYKILPYDHSKALRTNGKTTLWDLVPLSRRLQCYSITGLFIMALLFKLPWTAPTTWSITSSLGSLSNIIPVDKTSPGKSFFLVFTVQCQWVKQSCRRKHQRAKWNPLLIFIFSWQWICSWRKNRAWAPFPRAQLKPFNQKKVEWGRKGEDKRFGFKFKNLHMFTQLTLDTTATQRILCFVISTIPTEKKQNWKKANRKKTNPTFAYNDSKSLQVSFLYLKYEILLGFFLIS